MEHEGNTGGRGAVVIFEVRVEKGMEKVSLRAKGFRSVLLSEREKGRCEKDLVRLATFDVNRVYYGLGWKNESPTNYCFAIKHPKLRESMCTKYIKCLCGDDQRTRNRWVIGIRIAKHGRQLVDDYGVLVDELAQEELDLLAHAGSCSVSRLLQHQRKVIFQVAVTELKVKRTRLRF